MVKVAVVFLAGMVVLAMLGNLLFPGAMQRSLKKRLARPKTSTCKRCGRYVIGKSGCDCKKG
jgi:hypothetical protein